MRVPRPLIYRENAAAIEHAFMLEPNRFYQRCDLGAAQAASRPSVVLIRQRRACEDHGVGGFLHSKLRYVHGVPPKRSQSCAR